MSNSSPQSPEVFLPHVGWLAHDAGDDVARYLQEGWFEFLEQAFFWLYLRPEDVVIDCGAHVGLFTLLASQAVGARGRVIALEPHPITAGLLRRNVETAGARNNVEIIQAAAASASGSLTLHAGMGCKSAYSSFVANVQGSVDLPVAAVTIDEVMRERAIDTVALLKIDVEGAELDVWRGCAQAVAGNQLPLAMIEFTETNQRAAGATTADLVRAWETERYRLCRFDSDAMSLVAARVDGPIEYENLFAVRDVESVNRRLREASPQRMRVAQEIVTRGRACFEQMKRGADSEHLRGLVADMHRRMDGALQEADELADARERMLSYAKRVNRLLDSRAGRIARRLHLVSPTLVETVKSDMRKGAATRNNHFAKS